MPRISMLKRSVRAATAVALLVGLLSPANATSRQDTVAIFPDLPTNAVHCHKPIVLTSRQPWIAPVGHRQPHRADAHCMKPSRNGSTSNSRPTKRWTAS